MSRKKEYSVRRGRETVANNQLVAQQLPRQIDPMAYLAHQQRQRDTDRQFGAQQFNQGLAQQELGLRGQQMQQQSAESQARMLDAQLGRQQQDRQFGLSQDQFGFQQQNAQQQQAMALMQFLATMALNREKMSAEQPLTAAQIANYQAGARSKEIEAQLYERAMGGAQSQQDPDAELKARMRQELIKGK